MKLYTVVVHNLQMCMKEELRLPIHEGGAKVTYA
jgi:hypothetical protein